MVLQKLGPGEEEGVALPWDAVKEALDQMAESSANYVEKENILVLWDSLQVDILSPVWKEGNNRSHLNLNLIDI